MKVLRRLIYKEVLVAVITVSIAFLGLFFFFDLIDELPNIGKASPLDPKLVFQVSHALVTVGLLIPGRLYELLPITVLIGTIFVFARMAQGSEYTILRTSGLGPWRALGLMLALGLAFVGVTFVMGDYIAPASGKAAQLYKARFDGRLTAGPTGAWLREKQGDRQFSVNVGALTDVSEMKHIRIFEFDTQGHLLSRTQALTGHIATNGKWVLQQVNRSTFTPSTHNGPPTLAQSVEASWTWPTELTAEMVSVALLKPERMSTADLYQYVQHLDANGQSAQRYEIEFWRKVFYPLSCLVMMVLALPFAYLHFRSGTITGYVFVGVMVGISFFLLNNVFGYVGRLNNWEPWLAAAAPSILYSVASLTAFGWLVLKR
ncbi:MAG TPA: LPS export ABC transporter permease LptG [Burkholderiaceae bacterium]|nr:LPS export ABC transporter permease LptG [Burkholderiaceae bacterium]